MHFLIDARCLSAKNLTGVGVYAQNLLRALLTLDHAHHWTLFAVGRRIHLGHLKSLAALSPRVSLVLNPCPNKLFNALTLLGAINLDAWAEKQTGRKIDAVFFPNLNFLKVKRPYAITAHDLSFELWPEFLDFKRKLRHALINPRKIFRRAAAVIAVSENTRRDLRRLPALKPEKISVILSGLNYFRPTESAVTKIKRRYSLPEKFFLFVGTLEPRKNLAGLLKAFTLFSPGHPDWWLIIAGDKGWKQKNFSAILKCHPRIRRLNFINEETKNALYRLAGGLVFPSFYEGFGFPPLEAMAAGTPIILAGTASLPEIGGAHARYVDPFNPADLARALTELAETPPTKAALLAATTAANRFSWTRTAEKTLAVLIATGTKNRQA